MPYISTNDDRREKLRRGEPALTAGELNYQLFHNIKHNNYDKDMIKWLIDRFLGKSPNYQKYNDMTGALIRCAKEIERRLDIQIMEFLIPILNNYDDEIAKYEDKKIQENGDVE